MNTAIAPVNVDNWKFSQTRPTSTPINARGTRPAGITEPTLPNIDQIRYWVGASLTAAIAALTGVVGLIIAHGIFHVPVLLSSTSGLTPVHTALYALAAAGITLLAAGLFDAMLHIAPRPVTYYSWLAGMVTLLATLLPFTAADSLHSKIALAAINLAVGLVITLLVPQAATNARPRSDSVPPR